MAPLTHGLTTIHVNVRLYIDDKPMVAEWRINLAMIFARMLGVPLRAAVDEKTTRGNDPEGSSPRIGRREVLGNAPTHGLYS